MPTRLSAIWTPSGPIFVTETAVRQSNLGGVHVNATEPPEPVPIANVTGAQDTLATTQTGSVEVVPTWAFVAVSAPVPVSAAALTLTEPAGVQPGDLLVACIASRTTATTSVTLPANWLLVGEQRTNNTLSTTSAIASGTMAYIKRGASAPSFAFTLPAGISVAIGQVVAYRGSVATSAMLDVATAVTTAINTLPVSVAGLTATQAGDLIVALAAGGQEAAWSAFNATTPAGASGATSTAAPGTAWLERADTPTTTGADTSLAIFDAVKTTAGATGNLTVTASLGAGHVVIAGAFRIRDGAAAVTGAQTTSPTTQSATANVDLQVSAAQATLATTQAGAIQSLEARAVTGAQTTLEATQTATAGVRLAITTGTQTTSAVTQVAAADVDAKVTGAQNTSATTQSAAADVDLAVTGAQTTIAPTQSATASAAVRNVSAAQATLATTQSATAGVRLTVTGAQTLSAPTQSAAADVDLAVTAAQATLATTQAGTVGLGLAVTGAQTLSAATQTATATVRLAVTGAQTTLATTQSALVLVTDARLVVGNQTTNATTQSLLADVDVKASAAQTLTAATSTGSISIATQTKTLVRHAGVWKQATPYVRHAGVWKAATVHVKQAGTWKRA